MARQLIAKACGCTPPLWQGGVRKARVVHQVSQMKENYIYCLDCENFWTLESCIQNTPDSCLAI